MISSTHINKTPYAHTTCIKSYIKHFKGFSFLMQQTDSSQQWRQVLARTTYQDAACMNLILLRSKQELIELHLGFLLGDIQNRMLYKSNKGKKQY